MTFRQRGQIGRRANRRDKTRLIDSEPNRGNARSYYGRNNASSRYGTADVCCNNCAERPSSCACHTRKSPPAKRPSYRQTELRQSCASGDARACQKNS
ncbi:hypothetical protein LSAT2_029628 [Lamellibrachia satsuma]|nr:hypothetical protein LSAT2_029628 [Lamellibrachia satsuma]